MAYRYFWREGGGGYLVGLCDDAGSFFRFLFVFLQIKILSVSCSFEILDRLK